MGSRRRVSVDFYTGQAVSSMQQTVETLHQLWDDVSMEDHQRIDRVDGFYKILKQLMDDVIDSEKKMVESVHSSIDQWMHDVVEMRKELRLPPFDASGCQTGSIALFKALEKERSRLNSLKEDRLNGQLHMIEELIGVATRIGEEITELNEKDKVELWDNDRMEFWQQRLELLCRTLNVRLDKARQWKADMRRWAGQTKKLPNSEIEAVFFEINIDDSERVFDSAFMDEFSEAHEMAKENYNEWIEQADFDYTEAAVKLCELWDSCHVPEGDRRFAIKFNPGVHTESDVQNIKAEVQKLTQFHQERAAVYNKLKEWKELWAEKVSYENHANDKSYYQNRGGQLQALLQRQKHIENRLPVVLNELKKENELYTKEHPDAPIILDGFEPDKYVEWIVRDYRQQKDIERNRKKKGANICTPDNKLTPKKRAATPAFNTPATASKMPRVQSQLKMKISSQKVAGAVGGKNRDFSIYGSTTSLQSAIGPVRPLPFGPKTSSPIDTKDKGSELKLQSLSRKKSNDGKFLTMRNVTNDIRKRP